MIEFHSLYDHTHPLIKNLPTNFLYFPPVYPHTHESMVPVAFVNLTKSLINAGETAMWGDQNFTSTLPQHAANHVNGDSKWKLNKES